MTPAFWSLLCKLLDIGIIVAAASLWADADTRDRPKYRDEQTIIGGMIWSHTIIPLGLVISNLVDDKLSVYVHAYFLLAGFLLSILTGVIVIVIEINLVVSQRREGLNTTNEVKYNNRIYISIGLLSFLASILTFADFVIVLCTYFHSKR